MQRKSQVFDEHNKFRFLISSLISHPPKISSSRTYTLRLERLLLSLRSLPTAWKQERVSVLLIGDGPAVLEQCLLFAIQ